MYSRITVVNRFQVFSSSIVSVHSYFYCPLCGKLPGNIAVVELCDFIHSFAFQLSLQGAFIAAYLLHVLKHFLIDLSVKWTDVLEAVYKVLCKCIAVVRMVILSQLCMYDVTCIVTIGFIVPLVSFVLIIIPLMISLTTYR